MAKWSGKVYFPTASQANRAMAQGRYPRLPLDSWKPRPERQQVSEARVRLDGVLIMIEYGLQVMSDIRLSSLAGILQDELDRNERRWVPLKVERVLRGAEQISGERKRRQTLLNSAERLAAWSGVSSLKVEWTQEEGERLRNEWDSLLSEEEQDSS